MRINERIADKNAVFIVLENDFLLQQHTTDPIDCRRHGVTVELSDILMSLRTEVVALILMQAKVEGSPMLDDRRVKRAEQYMVVVVQFRNWHDKQPMVLPGVAVDDGRTGIGSRAVGPQQLSWKRVLKIGHQSLFKF